MWPVVALTDKANRCGMRNVQLFRLDQNPKLFAYHHSQEAEQGDHRSQRGVVKVYDHPRRIALAFRSDFHERSQPHELCATRDKRKQPEHVRRAAIRTDRGKWRKPHWPSRLATGLLTPINGKRIATVFVAIPNQLPISRLTNNRQTYGADSWTPAPLPRGFFRSRQMSSKCGRQSC